jgi:hypothetical protein
MPGRQRACDHDAVLALAREGKRPSEIAEALNAKFETIRDIIRRAQKAGVDLGPRPPRGSPRGPGAKVWTAPSRSSLYRKLRYAGGLPREEVLAAIGADVRAAQVGEGACNTLRPNTCKLSEHKLHDLEDHGEPKCITGQIAATNCRIAERDFRG